VVRQKAITKQPFMGKLHTLVVPAPSHGVRSLAVSGFFVGVAQANHQDPLA